MGTWHQLNLHLNKCLEILGVNSQSFSILQLLPEIFLPLSGEIQLKRSWSLSQVLVCTWSISLLSLFLLLFSLFSYLRLLVIEGSAVHSRWSSIHSKTFPFEFHKLHNLTEQCWGDLVSWGLSLSWLIHSTLLLLLWFLSKYLFLISRGVCLDFWTDTNMFSSM